MGTTNLNVFRECLPDVSDSNLELYIEHIISTCEMFEINTPERLSAFLAQIAYESDNFNHVIENLNYSAKGLMTIFKKYFPDEQSAAAFARQPERIANKVYANRMGNGSEHTGDGWRYRGRGLIQLTGKTNYMNCAAALGYSLNDIVYFLETPEGATKSAGWYWNLRNLNTYADDRDFNEITRKINGGYNGLEERTRIYQNALRVLENV